jgi:chemotaxis protein histidine kinase CheA
VNAPVGRREFFALEAGEYLERLTLLAAGPAQPQGEDLVRYARALRGAALMAGPPGYAVAAASIETVAKAVRDGGVAWTPALGEQLAQASKKCKGAPPTGPRLVRCRSPAL